MHSFSLAGNLAGIKINSGRSLAKKMSQGYFFTSKDKKRYFLHIPYSDVDKPPKLITNIFNLTSLYPCLIVYLLLLSLNLKQLSQSCSKPKILYVNKSFSQLAETTFSGTATTIFPGTATTNEHRAWWWSRSQNKLSTIFNSFMEII